MKRFLVSALWILLSLGATSLWAQDWKLVGAVAIDVFGSETAVNVNWACQGAVDRLILFESREGDWTEVREVKHIYENFLILKEPLENGFQQGSRVYQEPGVVNCQPPPVEKDMQPPTVACEPGSVRLVEGQSARLQARAADPNNDALTYAWSVNGQVVTHNEPFFNFDAAMAPTGIYTVQVGVTDVDGLSASCEFSVEVDRKPNQNPTVALSLDRSQVDVGEAVTASAQASDPDGDALAYAWTLDDRGRSETGSRIQIDTSALSGGRHSVSVTVQDERDGSATDVRSFSVSERIVIQINGVQPDNLAKARLDEIALRMQQDPRLNGVITGHTDDRGDEELNQRVGQNRADAVRDYLIQQHSIDIGRIETRSAGESQPIADNQTPEGQQQNRRVEIELLVP